ncbi:helix-turn-helix domain-containing protein [Proteus mirabilis]|uniref:helix-turn-helix domain-containing protein n=1 Tax=Proteus mirabilis TaxID=584 RepID=UPI0018C7CFD5|nr:helix-turn-helix transcriptional regulator [Proteus mirabilis]MBG2951238.1 helix-turn-helix transcriptional regulator [Proteus mirabilis]
MSSDRGKKLKAIREAEGYSQSKFSELTGINIGVIKNYEYGKQNPGISVIDRVLGTRDFEKYTLWLMTGKTNETMGQIEPSLSPDGHENTQGLLKVSNAGK